MIAWINFLHLYQPPTQSQDVIDRVAQESYSLLPRLLRQYPKSRFTINFAGSLLELLETHGYQTLLAKYRKLAEAGRIELVGSAMYHPILALLPEEEIRRQIMLQEEISHRIFGAAYRPKGFYIPEMTYSKKVADVVRALGFEWIILDEFHFPNGKPKSDTRYSIQDNGLRVLFRGRSFSKTFPPEFIITHRGEIKDQTIITAHDGELYGHWHKDDRGYYAKAFTDPDIVMPTVSEYLKSLSREEVVSPRESSWESLEEELVESNPFILWNARDNVIHQELWRFALFVIKTVNARFDDENYSLARRHADRGMASCAWWWATRAQLVATSPVCWNPSEIEKGARELSMAIRTLDKLSLKTRLKSEAMYARLTKLIWDTHWKIEAEGRGRKYRDRNKKTADSSWMS